MYVHINEILLGSRRSTKSGGETIHAQFNQVACIGPFGRLVMIYDDEISFSKHGGRSIPYFMYLYTRYHNDMSINKKMIQVFIIIQGNDISER